MSKGYVTFNAGSSSLKFSIFVENQAGLALRSHGEIERMSSNPHLLVKDGGGGVVQDGCTSLYHGAAHVDEPATLGQPSRGGEKPDEHAVRGGQRTLVGVGRIRGSPQHPWVAALVIRL